jgi:hypothetical protein
LHATWTQSRAKLFTSRGQTGGDADASYSCPLCCQDSRLLTQVSNPGLPSSSSNNSNNNKNNQKLIRSSSVREIGTAPAASERQIYTPRNNNNYNSKENTRPFTSPTKLSSQSKKSALLQRAALKSAGAAKIESTSENFNVVNNSNINENEIKPRPQTGVAVKSRTLRTSQSADFSSRQKQSVLQDSKRVHSNISISDSINSSIDSLPSLTMSQTRKAVSHIIKVRNW